MIANGIIELAIVISMAAVIGIILRLLRQPIILAYLATGAIIGYFGFTQLINQQSFAMFSDLGIMFLLFLIGLEINYSSLRFVGRAALTAGIAQIIFTSVIGFGIAHLFHFSILTSAYIGIALTFSSTIIVVKLLSEKRDLHSLYGKVSIGILLVQDMVAIMLLIVLSGLSTGQAISVPSFLFTIGKAVLLLIIMMWLGRKVFPIIFDSIARSHELLFLASLAWVFIMAAGAASVGLSIEIGGFLAGLALANSAETFQISQRMRSLRDFFILIFFVLLGSTLTKFSFSGLGLPIAAFSLFVLIGNPLIVLAIMGTLGYRKRTSFLTGITIAQVSEFSLILIALGARLGHVETPVVALITAVGALTIVVSTYLVQNGDAIARTLSPFLSLFERASARDAQSITDGFHKPIVLIGAHRTGMNIAHHLSKTDLLIIDCDPDIIHTLSKDGYECLLGDSADEDVLESAHASSAKLVISTNPDLQDNIILLHELHKQKNHPSIIVRAETDRDANALYRAGADYVIYPHFTSGHFLGKTIAQDPTFESLPLLKKRDLGVINGSL